MRVLVAGDSRQGSLGLMCRDGFAQAGYEAVIFDYRQLLRPDSHPFLRVRVIRRAFRPFRHWQVGRSLVRLAERFDPSVVLIIKGETLTPQTLIELRQRTQAKLANWNPDSPFNPSVSTAAVLKGIPLYDCYFTFAQHLIGPLVSAGAQQVDYLPFGYDPILHHPVSVGPSAMAKFACEVCFAGTWDPDRERILSSLLNFRVAVWGNGWERIYHRSPLKARWLGPARYGDDLAKIYSASKIVLNLLRDQNRGSHNMRSFEVPAIGAFLLTARSDEQSAFLEEDRECACYGDVDELGRQIRRYLGAESLRRSVALRGHHRVTHGRNTYCDRMKRVVDALSC